VTVVCGLYVAVVLGRLLTPVMLDRPKHASRAKSKDPNIANGLVIPLGSTLYQKVGGHGGI